MIRLRDRHQNIFSEIEKMLANFSIKINFPTLLLITENEMLEIRIGY